MSRLRYIKNIKTEYHYQNLISKKNYNYFVSTLIILKLIKRVGEEDLNTHFMDKLELLEYVYQRFNSLLLELKLTIASPLLVKIGYRTLTSFL